MTDEQLLGRGVRQRVVRLVRDAAGAFPGEEVLELGSPDGFLAKGLARESPRWTVYSTDADTSQDNMVPVQLSSTHLPFGPEQIAAAVGAFIAEPARRFSAAVVEDLFRVLAPRGRVLVVVREATTKAPDVKRTVPAEAAEWLRNAGFGRVAQRHLMHLPDGSQVSLLEATKPM